MKAARLVCSLVAVALVVAGLVAGGAQRSFGSVVASVTITSPEDGATVSDDVDVEAQAYGQPVDEPQKIEFFVDSPSRPAATVDCLTTSAAYGSSAYCGGRWNWHTSSLVGHHSLWAKVVLLDGSVSDSSQKVNVVVTARTQVTVHRAKHPVAGHQMAAAGRVRSLSKGRPGARHVPVQITTQTADGKVRVIRARTNRQGYYRKKIRAVDNTSITVRTDPTREYFSSEASYLQSVHGRARCGLSRRHAGIKQTVVLRCRMHGLPGGTRFQIQSRLHGKWYRAATFTMEESNHTKIYIQPRKHRTLVLREVFAKNAVYARSSSNVVRLHVT